MFLGLDLGTGSVKALLLSPDGVNAGSGSAAYSVDAPRPGWAETHPDAWWEAVCRAVGEAIGERGPEVRAVGLSGQMHGVVLARGDGLPLRPAVLWADGRSARELEAYEEVGEEAMRRLANPLAAGMAGPSLLWLRNHEPDVYSSARWALQPKDWLRMRLTGEVHSEPSDASATLLYDVEQDRWDREVVEALGLNPDLLAPLAPSGSVAGTLRTDVAETLRLPPGLPVALGGADTAAAMLGSDLTEPGQAQLTVGTGAQVVVAREVFSPDPNRRTHLFRTVRASEDDVSVGTRFYAMAAIQNAGLALEWVRGVLGATWDEVHAEAFSVAPGSGGVNFVPYLSGERTPVFDPTARGSWSGLGLGHTRAHLLRAAMEGVAFAIHDGVEALEAAGEGVTQLRIAGGGAVGEPWCRLICDVLQRPLLPLPDDVARVASARGAALLGGMAAGVLDLLDLPSPRTGEPLVPYGEAEYGEARARYRLARDRAAAGGA